MSFIDDILKYKSISIVGLEKNTGKTESLNYILSHLKDKNKLIAVTSIGVDGESTDSVTSTHKPEITVYENMLFVTSEKHYLERKITSEILEVSDISTSLGQLIIARAKDDGNVKLSGPSDTINLKKLINELTPTLHHPSPVTHHSPLITHHPSHVTHHPSLVTRHSSHVTRHTSHVTRHSSHITHHTSPKADIVIVDGALSRLSLASPTITDAMILATGAALSANIPELVRKTKYVYDLIQLPEIDNNLKDILNPINSGIKAVKSLHETEIIDLGIESVFSLDSSQNIFQHGNIIYIPGAVSDKVLNIFKSQKDIKNSIIIIKDFTKMFALPETFYSFIKKGGKMMVVNKPNLIAITINPVSPTGYILNSNELKNELAKQININIYNIRDNDTSGVKY
ncbi:hypothetical protein LJC73_04825 [Bacteroidales bacterium OttesenSCG-928-L14]|nr:hypothetical protein [Bacteroidales bacterium OttesenSCG-928-L14]